MTNTTLSGTTSRNGTSPLIREVDVTPDIAAEWLVANTHNRTLKPRAIARFADDMRNSDWRFNGEPIRFAVDGTLIDGQNRLHAIVESGATIKMLVITGLPMEVQETTDTGTPRQLHDVLKLRGEVNASSLAALIRKINGWKSGRRSFTSGGSESIVACIRLLDEHPELRVLVQPSRTVSEGCDLPASLTGLAWWVFQQIDYDDAEFFFARLADGQGLIKGDPIYELRRTLGETKNHRGERNQTYLLAITIKAWNAYRAGETVALYRWKPGGAKPEKFPEPV